MLQKRRSGVVAAIGAGAAVALIEVFWVAKGAPDAATLAVVFATDALVGIALVPGAVGIHALLTSGIERARWRVALAGAAVALIPWLLAMGVALRAAARRPSLVQWLEVGAAAAILPLGAIAALLLGALFGRSGRPALLRAGLAASCAALSVAAFVVDATVFVRLYQRLHYGAAYACLVLATMAVFWALPERALARWFWATPALPLVLSIALWQMPLTATEHTYIALRAPFAAKVMRLSRHVVDFDGDGFSPILGGGDCNDRDGSVNPAAVELPENGADEDCFGGDLKLEQVVALPPAAPARAPLPRKKPPIFVFTIDTLRADHVGAYGYRRPTTPNLDRLARESQLFVNAFAQSNNTASSVPALMTGRYPSVSPWSFDPAEQYARGWPFLRDDDNRTLAELLSEHGYDTFAVTSNPVLFRLGLEQDFARLKSARTAMLHEIEVALAQARDQVFAWIHCDQPHEPYSPQRAIFGQTDLDKYDAEIREADTFVQAVFDLIRARRLWDDAIIVVTSDHGEEFGEHGGRSHASSLYNEQIRVPLILRVPGIAGARIRANAELIDVLPTLLTLLDIETPPGVDGDYLLAPRSYEDSTAYSEHYNGRVQMRAIVRGPQKLLHRIYQDVSLEFYDLAADPGEKHNLIEVDGAVADVDLLRQHLNQAATGAVLRQAALVKTGDGTAMTRLRARVPSITDTGLKAFVEHLLAAPGAGSTTQTALIR